MQCIFEEVLATSTQLGWHGNCTSQPLRDFGHSREEQLLRLQVQPRAHGVAGAKVRAVLLAGARGPVLAAVVAVVPVAPGLPPAGRITRLGAGGVPCSA